jgi:hypothetical protein
VICTFKFPRTYSLFLFSVIFLYLWYCCVISFRELPRVPGLIHSSFHLTEPMARHGSARGNPRVRGSGCGLMG